MKTKITIILVLFFCCILGNKAQEKIIGGQTIDISQAPHQVGFFCKKNNGLQSFGGGFLINNQWILTARHVVENCTASNIDISLGHNNPNADNELKSVSQIIMHPNVDIALVKLSSPIIFTDNIAPINISNVGSYPINTLCEVTGWGSTYPNVSNSPTSQLKRCTAIIQSCSYDKILAEPSGNTPYHGDSGGALTMATSTGNKIAIGVVSRGDSDTPTTVSTEYVNIGNYYDWITSYVDLYSISGPDVICSTSTFNISAPGNCTYGLSPGLQIVSQTSNSLVVNATNNGKAYINIEAGNQIIIQHQFWVGAPIISDISYNNSYLKAETFGIDAGINYTEWTIGSNIFTSTSSSIMCPYSSGTFNVSVKARNNCGTSSVFNKQITLSIGYRYTVSMISNSKQVTVSQIENETNNITTIQSNPNNIEMQYTLISINTGVVNSQGKLPKSGGVLNFNQIKSGYYILTLFIDKGITESFKILLK